MGSHGFIATNSLVGAIGHSSTGLWLCSLFLLFIPHFRLSFSFPLLSPSLNHARRFDRAIFWSQYHPRRSPHIHPRLPQRTTATSTGRPLPSPSHRLGQFLARSGSVIGDPSRIVDATGRIHEQHASRRFVDVAATTAAGAIVHDPVVGRTAVDFAGGCPVECHAHQWRRYRVDAHDHVHLCRRHDGPGRSGRHQRRLCLWRFAADLLLRSSFEAPFQQQWRQLWRLFVHHHRSFGCWRRCRDLYRRLLCVEVHPEAVGRL